MKKLFLLFLLLTPFTAKAQPNQIEGRFTFHPNLNTLAKSDGYGGGLEFTNSFGEYLKLLQSFDLQKSRQGDALTNFNQRDITLQSTVRLYPVEGYKSFKPFVQGGVRGRFTKFDSATVIPLPVAPGFVTTENKFTNVSPFIGGGVNIKDYYVAEYSYFLPDFTSGLTDLNYRERGHQIRVKAFIPMGKKFTFNPAYRVFRREYEFQPTVYAHEAAFGLGYTFK